MIVAIYKHMNILYKQTICEKLSPTKAHLVLAIIGVEVLGSLSTMCIRCTCWYLEYHTTSSVWMNPTHIQIEYLHMNCIV